MDNADMPQDPNGPDGPEVFEFTPGQAKFLAERQAAFNAVPKQRSFLSENVAALIALLLFTFIAGILFAGAWLTDKKPETYCVGYAHGFGVAYQVLGDFTASQEQVDEVALACYAAAPSVPWTR